MGVARGARPRPGRSRLSRSAEFDRVFRHGRSHAGRELVVYVFPRGGDEDARLGLSVSRKVGGAVERNRVKRLLREAFALEVARLAPGTDVVVVARRGAGELAERESLAGIHRALVELVDRFAAPAELVDRDAARSAGSTTSELDRAPARLAPEDRTPARLADEVAI